MDGVCLCVLCVRSVFERDGAAVVVDGDSLQLLRGATVDYQQDLARAAFAVVRMPYPILHSLCPSHHVHDLKFDW
jgi:Fe-S cluster assembly iron-binding protein IscA